MAVSSMGRMPTGREVDDLGARDLRVEIEVEALEGPLVLEVGAADPEGELLGVAALGLVVEDPEEKLGVVEVAVDGLLQAQLEGVEDAAEAQLLEDGVRCSVRVIGAFCGLCEQLAESASEAVGARHRLVALGWQRDQCGPFVTFEEVGGPAAGVAVGKEYAVGFELALARFSSSERRLNLRPCHSIVLSELIPKLGSVAVAYVSARGRQRKHHRNFNLDGKL
nr:hypothetical protein [Nannocystis radixulma]